MMHGVATGDDGPAKDAAAYPRGRRPWLLLSYLTLLFVLSFVDRNMMRSMVDPIRASLGISDVQISLLEGAAFATLYSIMIIPMGFAADRFNRRTLLGTAVIGWSGMTMLAGFASSYRMLFVSRMGLGVGEAALQPCAMSMIRDSFPPQRRAWPLAIYTTAPLVGSALALVIGGALYGFAKSGGASSIPILGGIEPWQFAMVVPGLFGLCLGLTIFLFREPRRVDVDTGESAGLKDSLRHMRGNTGLYVLVFGAAVLWSLANTGWSAWLAPAIERQHHLPPEVVGPTAGTIALICSAIGSLGAGFLIDRRSLAGDRDAILKISIWLQALQIVPVIGMFTVQGTTGVWVCLALSNLLIGSMPIAAFAIITEITPGHHIGKIVALFNLAQNFLGQTIGSAVFAFVGEEVIGGPLGIAWAIILCYPLIMAVSLVLSVMLMRARRRFLARNG
ncbi:MFS transporter [Sphingomonas sp. CL5.1]|uniref:MFS transporter n=1 Tax=Sphingomonas sp. CL5.1 TaxID=2653203 RepID=UPI0015814F85|nr:MFS transporter [Sphingomonas sp. CL5.1]QKS01671.1 MFS transporter [Sphingomonas sp. CL5.1]